VNHANDDSMLLIVVFIIISFATLIWILWGALAGDRVPSIFVAEDGK
jgi:hypothetical protein